MKPSTRITIAVDMRLENYAYADIAGRVKIKEQTARKWFMVGGICHEAYEWKRAIRMQERRDRFAAIESQLHEIPRLRAPLKGGVLGSNYGDRPGEAFGGRASPVAARAMTSALRSRSWRRCWLP